MEFDLRAALPYLLPKAIAWAEERGAEILRTGVPLDKEGLVIAKRVGVAQPEKVRIAFVDDLLPLPTDPDLLQTAMGLFGLDALGITLGHSICMRREHYTVRLLSHECRHVHQYEQAGSIAAFLQIYLQQMVEFQYTNSPYEKDARDHEIKD
jgi:hypothetical protein